MRALAITMVVRTIVTTAFDVARPHHVVSFGAVVVGGFIALSLAAAIRSEAALSWCPSYFYLLTTDTSY